MPTGSTLSGLDLELLLPWASLRRAALRPRLFKFAPSGDSRHLKIRDSLFPEEDLWDC